MSFEQTKSLGGSIEIRATNRPIKVAYLVPYEDNAENNALLDAVFQESYTRWGGFHTLLVPVSNAAFLHDSYGPWLAHFDPDFVYSYLDLEKEFIQKIDTLCCPMEFLRHKVWDRSGQPNPEPDMRSYLPKFSHYLKAVSSVTTIPSPYVAHPSRIGHGSGGEVMVLTEFGGHSNARVFADNFGTGVNTSHFMSAVPGLFRTLCLVPPDTPASHHVGTEKCQSLVAVFKALASNAAISIARLAMIHSDGIPRVEPYPWSSIFNIFVGQTVLDRLHFWNSRHFTRDSADTIGGLRIDASLFNDPSFVEQLGEFLNKTNFLSRSSGGPYGVSLRSYSHSFEELISFRDALQKKTYNAIYVLEKEFNLPAVPAESDIKDRYYGSSGDSTTVKVTESSVVVTASAPAHFVYMPPRLSALNGGNWAVDLGIQRHNNLSHYLSESEFWVLPRRVRAAKAFTGNPSKVTSGNALAVIPTSGHSFGRRTQAAVFSYRIDLRSDEDWFRYLTLNFLATDGDDIRGLGHRSGYKVLQLSDKGQNLRGVVSMFENLHEAYNILTNKFWRAVLRSFKEDSSKYLTISRDELGSFVPNGRDETQGIANELRLKNRGEAVDYMKRSLDDTLEYLVRIGVFFQVYQWRCEYCGHSNSRSFGNLKVKNSCEICETEYFPPIDLVWDYQLNEFVFRALVKNNGLTVLWALGHMQDCYGRNSFWYLPEVDFYEDYDNPLLKNEIDILCMTDGAYRMIEVKQTVSLFVRKPGEVEKFIKMARRLEPDVAMLVFERYVDENIENPGIDFRALLRESEARIAGELGPDIRLQVIVACDIAEFNEFPHDLGHHGPRMWEFNTKRAQ